MSSSSVSCIDNADATGCNALLNSTRCRCSFELFAHEDFEFAVATMNTLAKLELVNSIETAKDAIPEVIELSSETITIGRSTRLVTVVLDLTPNTISRRHAEIVYTKTHEGKDVFAIKDLASTNGVFVNDVKIDEHPLEHGDVVQFGGAADIAVGTRFDGSGSHIRYRFAQEVFHPPPNSRKRRPASGPSTIDSAVSPPAQRPTKLQKSSTSNPKRTDDSSKAGKKVLMGGKAGAADLADTQNAADALRAIANGSRSSLAANGVSASDGGADTCATRTARKCGGGTPAVGSVQEGLGGGGGGGGGTESQERMPALVLEVLGDAMCGLCSELLLDAGVLPCSHSFCRLCWADHVAEKDTTCPVCMRKFHKSESNPRRCVNLDLLITSLVHKLAGAEVRRRWEKRQEHAKERAAAAEATTSSATSPATSSAATTEQTSLSRTALERVEVCETKSIRKASNLGTAGAGSTGGAPVRAQRVLLSRKGFQPERCGRGDITPEGQSNRGSLRGSTEDGKGGQAPAAACEGCNETGHEFRECPHRSDSAADRSDDQEEDEDEDEDEDEEDEDGEEEDSDDV